MGTPDKAATAMTQKMILGAKSPNPMFGRQGKNERKRGKNRKIGKKAEARKSVVME